MAKKKSKSTKSKSVKGESMKERMCSCGSKKKSSECCGCC